jgi:hypothetical protein
MKRKWLFNLGGALLAITLAFGFAACGGDDEAQAEKNKMLLESAGTISFPVGGKTLAIDFSGEAVLMIDGAAAGTYAYTVSETEITLKKAAADGGDAVLTYEIDTNTGKLKITGGLNSIKVVSDAGIEEDTADSDENDELKPPEPSSPGSPPFSNAQVYSDDGSEYTGNALVKIRVHDQSDQYEFINAGTITNGKLTLELPATLDAKYLQSLSDYIPEEVIDSPTVKSSASGIHVYDENGKPIGLIEYEKETFGANNSIVREIFLLIYLDRAVTVKGSESGKPVVYDFTGVKGWNWINWRTTDDDNQLYTNNMFADGKWRISDND